MPLRDNDRTTRIIALGVIVFFFLFVAAILFGAVNVTEPATAKLIGALFGYITGVVNTVMYRFFGKLGDTDNTGSPL